MSQAGKVLHLYVEVRPVAEEDGTPGGTAGTGQLMLQCPEPLPHSQRGSNRSSSCYSPEPFPASHLRLENNCVSPTKSSRQSVTFQLQNPDAPGSSGQDQRRTCDTFGQLLQVLAPGTLNRSSHHGSAGPTWPERDPKQGRLLRSPSPAPSGRMTSPPGTCAAPVLGGDGGQTSLVTYGYIEKSHVHQTAARHAQPDGAFNGRGGPLVTHTQKRLSDPLWYAGRRPPGDRPGTDYPCSPPQNLPQWCWSYAQRAADAGVSRDARTLDELTSPTLRRRYGGYNAATGSPTLPRTYQSPRCRSWAGSPVLPRGSLTLPSKAQPADLDRGVCRHSVNGLPRSPASDRLCAHTQYSPCPVAPARNAHCQSQTWRAQRSQVTEEGPRPANRFYPPLPAGRPTDIQHQLWVGSRGRTGYYASGQPRPCGYYSHPNANNANRGHCSTGALCYSVSDDLATRSQYSSSRSRSSSAVSPTSSRRSISPSSNDTSKLTADRADRATPSPSSSPAESRRSESPSAEGTHLHPYASLPGRRSPERSRRSLTRPGGISAAPSKTGLRSQSQSPVLNLHRQRAPSPRGDSAGNSAHHHHLQPSGERRQHHHSCGPWQRDSPEGSRRGQAQETPASLTSWSQEWRESGPRGASGAVQDERQGKVKGRQTPLRGLSREHTELPDHTGSGASSHSSSGVTGSVGDSSHPSPETSSQSSQDTSGTGSAMQVGWAGGRWGWLAPSDMAFDRLRHNESH